MQKAEYSVLEIWGGTEKSDQKNGPPLAPVLFSVSDHLKRLHGGSPMCSSPFQGAFSSQNIPALTKALVNGMQAVVLYFRKSQKEENFFPIAWDMDVKARAKTTTMGHIFINGSRHGRARQ